MIPLFRVHHPVGVGDSIESIFKSGMITEGSVSDEFEAKFGKLIDNEWVSLVNSATSGLTLAYRLCNIEPGDEVITTPMTCMATNEPLMNMGAQLVWADIDPTTGNIDPASVKKRITPRTKAIVGVHWAGQPFDIDGIASIFSNDRYIPVVADAAHALGATYLDANSKYHNMLPKQIGSWSYTCDFTVFSFQAIKHLTTGDGGALACSNKNDYERAKLLRWFGIDRKYKGSKWEQDISEAGYKFHMNNLTAAIGLAQMPYIKAIIESHISNGKRFDAGIVDSKRVKKLRRPENCQSAHWIYSLLVDDVKEFKTFMEAKGIATDTVHVRNDRYSVFKQFRRDDLPGVDDFCSRMINIPVGWWLSDEDVQHIIRSVNEF